MSLFPTDYIFAFLPMIPAGCLLMPLVDNPFLSMESSKLAYSVPILAFLLLAVMGFLFTNQLVPHIKVRRSFLDISFEQS
jgi:hypothetical protein